MKKLIALSILPFAALALSSCASLDKQLDSAKSFYSKHIETHETVQESLTAEQSAELQKLELNQNSLVDYEDAGKGIEETKKCLASRQGKNINDPRNYYSRPGESEFADCIAYGRTVNDELIAAAQERKARQDAARQAREDREQRRLEQHRQKRACLNSDEYKRAVAAFVIRYNRGRLYKAEQEEEHEKEVEQLSGVQNLSTKRRLAETQISASKKIKNGYALYMKYGGTAMYPKHISSREAKNPCDSNGQWGWIGPGLSDIE